MAEPYLGEIRMFAGTFAPSGWAMCNGQLMAISQNAALFSILGTNFGGNGVSTFGLPDFRGRVPVHQGQGLGLANYVVGEQAGVENVALIYNNMPSHTHTVNGVNGTGNQTTPTNNLPATVQVSQQNTHVEVYSNAAANTTMNSSMIQPAGGNVPFSVIQPVLCVTFIIALNGIFPSRN